VADILGQGSDLPTGRIGILGNEPTGGGPYPPEGAPMDVIDHPAHSGHKATEHHDGTSLGVYQKDLVRDVLTHVQSGFMK
jgi:hypothetical protein